MSRREELEREVAEAKDRLDNAPADTPKEILDIWRQEYDELSVDLTELFDEYDPDQR
ncbi:MAG: hypothetical protein LUE93_10170 [Bacteroides sp.]|nr:hypothetical protein [Bacteroides sp.]